MAIYGSLLSAFPELMTSIKIYKADVKVDAGLKKRRLVKTIRGIIQYVKGGNTDNKNGSVIEQEKPYLWTTEKLDNLLFVNRDKDEFFRIVGNNDWSREGSFYKYELEKFNGATDKMRKDKTIKQNMTEYL